MSSARARMQALSFGGGCIGTILESAEEPGIAGKKILVPETVPGETVEAAIVKDEKRLAYGELLRVVEPSKERIPAPCKLFGRCGGCELQHINLDYQRVLKKEMVLTMLERQAGIIPAEVDTSANDLPGYGYRRRVMLHINRDGEIGFFKKSSSEVVDADFCHISSSGVNLALEKLRRYREGLAPYFSSAVIEEGERDTYLLLKLREDAKDWELPPELPGDFPLYTVTLKDRIQVNSINDDYPAGHFSQVNAEGNERLIDIVTRHAYGSEVTDLYAGHGNFSLPLAAIGSSVRAVELSKQLVRFGEKRAKAAGFQKKVSFYSMSCEAYFRKHQATSCVVLDPPRSGAKNIIKHISRERCEKIIYVSCSLPTFCRDAKELNGNGFKLAKLYLVDMFPQTHHIELVGIFS